MKADDLTPVIHGLREIIAAMGLDPRSDVLLAFASRPSDGASGGERGERAPALAAGFPFGVLLGWSASLSDIYQSTGARFDQVLFNAVDPQRLVAWNNVTPDSVPERSTAKAGTAGSLGPGIDAPYLLSGPAPGDKKPGEKGDKAERRKRTIIYMQRDRTTVMTIDEPAKK